MQLCGVTVRYFPQNGKPVVALDNVHLKVHEREILGIIGESGSGKSTLAGAMLRMLPQHAVEEGPVLFRGDDLLGMDEAALRQIRGASIAMIPQDPALVLNPVMRVGGQIAEVLRAHVKMRCREREARVHELLVEVGFAEPTKIYSAYPHQLSGGERQRIVIAQAMACGASLVIADEPTSKLDAPLQAQILALMVKLLRRRRTALVWITHDPTVLAGFADRIAVMYAGRIVEEGCAQDLLQQPLHPYTAALLKLSKSIPASEGALRRFPLIPGEPPDLTQIGAECPFEPRCTERMQVCASRDPKESSPTPFRRVRCFKYDN